jgi:hypothetical protein
MNINRPDTISEAYKSFDAALDQAARAMNGFARAMREATRQANRDINRRLRKWRKRNAREKKRHDIETRQVARAIILAGRVPTLIHNGKAMR